MKPKLFVDFDGVIANSVDAVAYVYNRAYCHSREFKKAIASECTKWNMKDICPLIKDIESIFDEPMLFSYLQPFPQAVKVLKELSNKYQIIIITIGNDKNLQYKIDWIHLYLPFIEDIILIKNKGCKMDKSVINMSTFDNESHNVFIDDSADNLFSVQGQQNLIRYCFAQRKTEWNAKWLDINGRVLKDWNEIRDELMKEEEI